MNRTLSIMMLLPVILPGCQSQPEIAPQPVELVQWSGETGGADTPRSEVIRTAEDWSSIWQRIGREPPRPLDPPGEMAVAIELGVKFTGGYSVEVAGTRVQAGALVVDYREIAPPPGALVTQSLTNPWVIAVMPASSLPVVFRGYRILGRHAGE